MFVGTMYSQYPWNMPSLEQAILSSNGTDWQITNRSSHFFNLTGPSIAINSACSSSLTAIHLACESLKQKNCSMAIAGGINLTLDPSKYDSLQRAKFLGSGNQSKSFGAGDGYIPGEGVGAVLLKPLSKAIQDNDRIDAVIRSSFVNHSGGRQMYGVPDPKQQGQLIATSIQRSGIDPLTMGYVESAANGSELGDPIEVIALSHAFAQYTNKQQYCALGSVKSNVGHLEAASGISQLSKVILQLRHKTLVPSINATPRNSNIKLERTAFYLQEETEPWPSINDPQNGRDLPRRAMINSFGAGGAYANLIIEEYLKETETPIKGQNISFSKEHLFIFSAKTEWSLLEYMGRMQNVLKENPSITEESVAWSLQKMNHGLEHRAAILASSNNELSEKLGLLQKARTSFVDSNISLSWDQKFNKPPSTDPSIIQEAIEKKELRELARYWTAGAAIDFTQLQEGPKSPWIPLPKYAFEHSIRFDFNSNNDPMNDDITQPDDEFYRSLLEKISKGEVSDEQVESLLS